MEILKKAIQSFWIHGKVNTAGGNVRPCRLVWNVFSCCKCLNRVSDRAAEKIDESLLAKVERLEPPPLLAYLDAHLNEERYYQDWQKIFFELGHIYNKADGHAEKSLPSYTCARQWLQHYGYDLQKRRVTSGELRNKNVWWVTKQ